MHTPYPDPRELIGRQAALTTTIFELVLYSNPLMPHIINQVLRVMHKHATSNFLAEVSVLFLGG